MSQLVLVAPLLIAAAYEKVTERLAPEAPSYVAAPAAAHRTTAGASGVQGTAAVSDVVNAANAFIATLSASKPRCCKPITQLRSLNGRTCPLIPTTASACGLMP